MRVIRVALRWLFAGLFDGIPLVAGLAVLLGFFGALTSEGRPWVLLLSTPIIFVMYFGMWWVLSVGPLLASVSVWIWLAGRVPALDAHVPAVIVGVLANAALATALVPPFSRIVLDAGFPPDSPWPVYAVLFGMSALYLAVPRIFTKGLRPGALSGA